MASDRTHFEYDGFAAVSQSLKQIEVSSPDFQDKIRKAVWQVLGDVRQAVIQNTHFANSKHNSIAAIRRTVYKKIMGGNVNILDKRKGTANKGAFVATGQSGRTQQINGYSGVDRGFILRFVNSGTRERYASGRNRSMGDDYLHSMKGKPGYRGRIEPQNFFAPTAQARIQLAAEDLASLIESEIELQYYNK